MEVHAGIGWPGGFGQYEIDCSPLAVRSAANAGHTTTMVPRWCPNDRCPENMS